MEHRSISYSTRYISDSHVQEVDWDTEPILKVLQLENSLQPPGINPQSFKFVVICFNVYVICSMYYFNYSLLCIVFCKI